MWEEPAPEVGEEVADDEITDAIDALRDEPDEPDDELDEETDGATESETIEDIAKEIGWNPNHGKEGFVSAAEFIRKGNDLRANASKGLKETKRKLESMESAIMDIKKHYEATSKAQEAKYKKQLDALKKRRVEAIEEGDADAVDAVEGEMNEIYSALDKPKKDDTPGVNAEDEMLYAEWQKENDWYTPTGKGGDMEKTLYADEIADRLSRYPELSFEKKLEIVTQKVNQKFSEPSPKKTPPVSPVEGARPGRPRSKGSNVVLNKEEKAIGRALVNSGVMSMDEYKADVALQREV